MGTDRGEVPAATWQWFTVMHEALGGGEPIDLPVVMDASVAGNPAPVADEALDASRSSLHASVEATRSPACVEEEVEEVEQEEDTQHTQHFSPYPCMTEN